MSTPPAPPKTGATVVITHRVRDQMHAEYENWLLEIGPISRASPGLLDWQIIRPLPNFTVNYTIIIRFDTTDHLRQWIESDQRTRLIEKARPLLANDDAYDIHSGLDFWFMPQGVGNKTPVRWKQFLITWTAIYPLSLVIPLLALPSFRQLGLPHDVYLDGLLISAVLVWLMVYVVMPRYTRLVRHWLFA